MPVVAAAATPTAAGAATLQAQRESQASRLVATTLVVPTTVAACKLKTQAGRTRITNTEVTTPSSRVVVVVDGVPMVATVDSGADACVMFKHSLLRTKQGPQKYNTGSVGTATVANGPGQSFRKVSVDIGIGATTFEQTVIVFEEGPGDVDLLISSSLLQAIGGHAVTASSLVLFRGDEEVLEAIPLLPQGARMPAAVNRVRVVSHHRLPDGARHHIRDRGVSVG